MAKKRLEKNEVNFFINLCYNFYDRKFTSCFAILLFNRKNDRFWLIKKIKSAFFLFNRKLLLDFFYSLKN